MMIRLLIKLLCSESGQFDFGSILNTIGSVAGNVGGVISAISGLTSTPKAPTTTTVTQPGAPIAASPFEQRMQALSEALLRANLERSGFYPFPFQTSGGESFLAQRPPTPDEAMAQAFGRQLMANLSSEVGRVPRGLFSGRARLMDRAGLIQAIRAKRGLGTPAPTTLPSQ